ncbi:MAG TPA: HD domain-containing protein [Lentimicrobium sp.]|jgi:hypothetical protein|nr:HD domain-containing protein [Lentimicrobium sp.]
MHFEITVNPADFNLVETQFDHHSNLHGILHSYRVMCHVLRLGALTGYRTEARTAFMAAYIHDMARRHDGYCTRHGADSANTKLPLYRELFLRNGAEADDLFTIGVAVTQHSLGRELTQGDPAWLVTALLKDADALDRIRLGANDLDPAYLRLPETHLLIPYARELFYQTSRMKPGSFTQILKIAEETAVAYDKGR